MGNFVWAGLGVIALSLSMATGVMAAERLRIQIGPLSQSINLSDLETFSKTGELPSQLRFYRRFFSPQLQQLLNKRLPIQGDLLKNAINKLWQSSTGNQLLDQLKLALPGSTSEDIKAALNLAIRHRSEISVLNLLRAYPEPEVTIDLTAIASLISQLNLPNLQNQMLSPILADKLETSTKINFPSGIDPTQPGDQVVRQRTLTLQDSQRDRTITLDIYDSPNPQGNLVMMSHGFAANRRFLQYIAYHLASHGFTVVSPEHPGSNINFFFQNPLGLDLDKLLPASEFVDRPKDITFILNELEKLQQKTPQDYNFDTHHVTIIGHSFGGYTALAVAGGTIDPPAIRNHCDLLNPLIRSPGDWLQCAAANLPHNTLNLRDKRIVQAIAFNPLVGSIFGKEGLQQIKIPTLILSSSNDGITPSLANQLRPFEQLTCEKYLAIAIGATHMSVTDLSNRNSPLAKNTLVGEILGEEALPVRELAKALSLVMLEQQTPEAETYRPFLSPTYVQFLSSEQIQLRLTSIIPPDLERWLSKTEQKYPIATEPTKPAIASFSPTSFLPHWPQKKPILTYPTHQLQQSFVPLIYPTVKKDQVQYFVPNKV